MRDKEKLINEVIALPVKDKAEIIDLLIKSLHVPDEAIDRLWKKEAESRINAYQEGKISSVSVEEAILKFKNR
ncbi:addiction module protein [Rhodohalobacter sp. 614A]|uniref:addiction module protein n=1 Tax=Rhodohalobacter sp. 614A TaxID=2908649 RepID=UPI001F2DD8A6|nr:addiction module protein [Rhodohalobacter sp. 614A]